MKKTILFFTAVALVTFSIFSCGGDAEQKQVVDSSKPANGTVSATVDGKALYQEKCMLCHGDDGTAGTMGAADLSISKIDHPSTVTIIKNGRNGMRAFNGELNDEQIDAVAKYIETLRK